MIENCPVCGNGFEILWLHLWAYKRNGQYICSWKCLRENEKRTGVNEMSGKSKVPDEAKKKAIQAALYGKDPYEPLRPYTSNPKSMWTYIKMMVKQKDPELYAKIPDLRDRKKPKQEEPKATLADAMAGMQEATDTFFSACEKMGLKTIVDNDVEAKLPEKKLEKRVTGIMVEIGDFHYYPKTGYVDWTPVGHTDTVSLLDDEWRQVVEDLPKVLRELGVSL